ncbi:MAG: TetR/AcrR family transcriptional regulator [Butyrivibrio sp.]|nr:TetR/AcrR family transcriptional regulator [Butyrivibrio sp.]
MPKDKTASHVKVMAALREEFLEKGFEGASIRSIGERAGMSAAGLYRHYKNKNDMFDAMVQPLVEDINRWLENHKRSKYELLDGQADKAELFDETVIDLVKEVIYPRKKEFQMLFCCSQGTKYENFIHDFVAGQQGDMAQVIRYMKGQGYPVQEPLEEELHILLSAYVTAVLEPVIHDYSEEKTMHCLDIIKQFFTPGWMKIMGL